MDNGPSYSVVATVNGIDIAVQCSAPGGSNFAIIRLTKAGTTETAFGWATETSQGATTQLSFSAGNLFPAAGVNDLIVGANAAIPAAAGPIAWTHLDAWIVRGTRCNFHLLVTPGTSA